MNIILGESNAKELAQKWIVLELDQFTIGDNPEVITAYCVLEDTPLQELLHLNQFFDLHCNLIKNFRAANFNFCLQAIDHLRGHWGGQVDSFYDELVARIQQISPAESASFDHVIHKH